MNAEELDRRVRVILCDVTPETSFRATRELFEIGFDPVVAFRLVEACIKLISRKDPADV